MSPRDLCHVPLMSHTMTPSPHSIEDSPKGEPLLCTLVHVRHATTYIA